MFVIRNILINLFGLVTLLLMMPLHAQKIQDCNLAIPQLNQNCTTNGLSSEQLQHNLEDFCQQNDKAACSVCSDTLRRTEKSGGGACNLAKCITRDVIRKNTGTIITVDLPAGSSCPTAVYRYLKEPLMRCGDGILSQGESCDDGNTTNNDGCCSNCTLQTGYSCNGVNCTPKASVCGDGVVSGDEVCDDGNTTSGDGCCGNCKNPEPGYSCPESGGACIKDKPVPANVKWNCKS
jgi:cysteine-rich repeat protein